MNFSLHPYNKVPLWKNPHNKSFSMDFPIIEANYSTEAEIYNEGIRIILDEMDDAHSKTTNVKAKMTGWHVSTPTTNKLVDWIKKVIMEETDTPTTKYELVDSWFAHYNKGDYTDNHAHYPQLWSFVYFVKSPPDSAPLVFTTSQTAITAEQNRVVIVVCLIRLV